MERLFILQNLGNTGALLTLFPQNLTIPWGACIFPDPLGPNSFLCLLCSYLFQTILLMCEAQTQIWKSDLSSWSPWIPSTQGSFLSSLPGPAGDPPLCSSPSKSPAPQGMPHWLTLFPSPPSSPSLPTSHSKFSCCSSCPHTLYPRLPPETQMSPTIFMQKNKLSAYTPALRHPHLFQGPSFQAGLLHLPMGRRRGTGTQVIIRGACWTLILSQAFIRQKIVSP